MGQPVTVSTASVPTDYCYRGPQLDWPFFVSLLMAELAGANYTFNFGPTTPAPDDQDKPWFRTNVDGTPDRLYVYSGGSWVAKHAIPAGAVWLYEGAEGSIPTFDGGEAGVVTATTGPMWEKVSQLDGRFPIGPGTVGSTTIGVGDTGGTHEHTLLTENIPAHTHTIPEGANYVGSGNLIPPRIIIDDDYGTTKTNLLTGSYGGQADGTTKVVSHLNPYRGIFFIRKTARTHYRI